MVGPKSTQTNTTAAYYADLVSHYAREELTIMHVLNNSVPFILNCTES